MFVGTLEISRCRRDETSKIILILFLPHIYEGSPFAQAIFVPRQCYRMTASGLKRATYLAIDQNQGDAVEGKEYTNENAHPRPYLCTHLSFLYVHHESDIKRGQKTSYMKHCWLNPFSLV